MRLDKILSNLKYGSRSDIKAMAKAGYIEVNGIKAKSSDLDVDPIKDIITLEGVTIFYKEFVYLMMNKPKGIVCAATDSLYPTFTSLISNPFDRFELSVCGRLDVDSEGLIILTNDGVFLHKVISPKNEIYKIYRVTLARPLADYRRLEKGVSIMDGQEKPYVTKPAKIFDVIGNTCRIAISEGKFHQVKRMFEAIGNEVTELKRETIGALDLDPALESGGYRELTDPECLALLNNKQ